MFKNFKINLDVIVDFLIAQVFIVGFSLFCIQYGISFWDKICFYICTAGSISFMVKAIIRSYNNKI